MTNTSQGEPDLTTSQDASSQAFRFTQSQFVCVFVAVAGFTIVLSRIARFAGSGKWISGLTTDVFECTIWCVLAIPLVYVALRSRMAQTTRFWFIALIVFQTADVVLGMTASIPLFHNIPILGRRYVVYDGPNGSLNAIAIFLFGAAAAGCMFYVWFLAMSEADLIRDSLARETERLDAEIRERERAEERIQELTVGIQHSARLNMIGEIVAGVAHELHQPLGAIANYANGSKIRMRSGKLEPQDASQMFDQIADTAIHAGTIVDRIKSFAQNKSPNVLPSDANISIRDAVELAEFDIKKRQIDLTLDLATQLPLIPIDQVEVTQVVLNLILNAIDAIDAVKTTRRMISIRSQGDARSGVLISVFDSGAGVEPGDEDKLYDQFFTTKPRGLGMGLAICRAIVDRYEGRLWHEPNDPTGTVFHFTLPVEQSDPKLKRLAMEKLS